MLSWKRIKFQNSRKKVPNITDKYYEWFELGLKFTNAKKFRNCTNVYVTHSGSEVSGQTMLKFCFWIFVNNDIISKCPNNTVDLGKIRVCSLMRWCSMDVVLMNTLCIWFSWLRFLKSVEKNSSLRRCKYAEK